MDIPLSSHVNWGSVSNTLDCDSTMMFTEERDGNVAPPGFYRRLLLGADMAPPPSDRARANDAESLLNLDDIEQLDCEPSQEQLQLPQPSEPTVPLEFPTADQSAETARGEDASSIGVEDLSAHEPATRGRVSSHAAHKQKSNSPPVLLSGEKNGGIGVTFHKKNKQWEAHLWIKGEQLRGRKRKGVQIFLGNFVSKEDARMAHDRAALKFKEFPQQVSSSDSGKPYQLNFPEVVHKSYMEEHADWTARDFLWKIRRTSNKFSKGKSSLKGVSVRKRSVRRGQEWTTTYEAKLSLTVKEFGVDAKQMFVLGNFSSEEEAGRAYDGALLGSHQHLPEMEQLLCITNFRPSSYSAAEIETARSRLPPSESTGS